jgi:hypothetical protein
MVRQTMRISKSFRNPSRFLHHKVHIHWELRHLYTAGRVSHLHPYANQKARKRLTAETESQSEGNDARDLPISRY